MGLGKIFTTPILGSKWRWREPFFVGTTLKGRLKQKLAAIGVCLLIGIIGMLVLQDTMNNPTLTPVMAMGIGAFVAGMAVVIFGIRSYDRRGTVKFRENEIVRERLQGGLDMIGGWVFTEVETWPFGAIRQCRVIPHNLSGHPFSVLEIYTSDEVDWIGVPQSVDIKRLARRLEIENVPVATARSVSPAISDVSTAVYLPDIIVFLVITVPLFAIASAMDQQKRDQQQAAAEAPAFPPVEVPKMDRPDMLRGKLPRSSFGPPRQRPQDAGPSGQQKPREEKATGPDALVPGPRGGLPPAMFPGGGPPGVTFPRDELAGRSSRTPPDIFGSSPSPPGVGFNTNPRSRRDRRFRTWSDTTGKFHVEAALIAYRDDKITLRRPDGRTLMVPTARLSQADRALAAKSRPFDEYSRPANSTNRDTELVGESENGTFRYEKDVPLQGVRFRIGHAPNGKKTIEHFMGVHDREPVMWHESRMPRMFRSMLVIARDGYAVGALKVDAQGYVRAIQVVFMRVMPDGRLDTSDSYNSDWIGSPTGKPIKTLGATGASNAAVVGVYGHAFGSLEAVGLVIKGP